MTPDPRRVQAVFLAALEQETFSGRVVVLDRECESDMGLRLRVEALLIAHDKPDSLLDRHFIAAGQQVAAIHVPPADRAGKAKPPSSDLEPKP